MSMKRRNRKMSKPIKMTQQYLDECRQDFEKALQLIKLADGKLNFTKTFTCGNHKAIVYFTPEAWAKMVMLVKEFDKEVAWHGVASRIDDDTVVDEYLISDILVYPQSVTGATVEMDTEEYAKWIMDNIEDKRFNEIHMQGHSHVNMPPNPSSVDLTHQEEILNMLGDEDFYIFMIWNKSFVSNTKLYDMKKNILFENTDVTIKIIGGSEDLEEFLKSAKEMVKTKTYQSVGSYSDNSGCVGYYGYTGYTGRYSSNPYHPLSAQTPKAKDNKEKECSRSGKKEKSRTRIGAGWSGADDCEQRTLFDEVCDTYGYEDNEGYCGR